MVCWLENVIFSINIKTKYLLIRIVTFFLCQFVIYFLEMFAATTRSTSRHFHQLNNCLEQDLLTKISQAKDLGGKYVQGTLKRKRSFRKCISNKSSNSQLWLTLSLFFLKFLIIFKHFFPHYLFHLLHLIPLLETIVGVNRTEIAALKRPPSPCPATLLLDSTSRFNYKLTSLQ